MVHRALASLLNELINGAGPKFAFVLNPEDPGLLRSLDQLSAAAASAVPPGGTSSIAAHVDHVRYGLQLLNRWMAGENPFDTADYSASWRRVAVSDEEWSLLRRELQREAHAWIEVVKKPRELNHTELKGVISSAVHLAYHMGAIRQMDSATRGPRAKPLSLGLP